MIDPIVCRAEDLLVLGGHQRLSVAVELGLETVPVALVPGLSDDRAAALNILLNNPKAQGAWDMKALSDVLSGIDARGVDATLTGFNDSDLERILTWQVDPSKPKEEDESEPLLLPATEDDADSVLGTVYSLGRHRLICGDATDPRAWHALLGDQRVDIVWTDPPYNVNYDARGGREGIENDNLLPMDFRQLLEDSLTLAASYSKPGAAWYVASPGGPDFLPFAEVLSALGVWRQTIQWVKDSLVLGRSDFHYRNEPIFQGATPTIEEGEGPPKRGKRKRPPRSQPMAYGWKPGAAHHFVKERTLDTVWEVPRPKRSEEHPTMKPVELIRRSLRASSDPGALVADCFAGSGSTLIAGEQTGRTVFMIEKSRGYCDVIRRRYEAYVAQNAVAA